MTTATFVQAPDGRYLEFTCFGHAGKRTGGRSKGSKFGGRLRGNGGNSESEYDLLCCAISALVAHTVNALSDLACEDIAVTENEETGFLRCEIRSRLGEASVLLVDALKMSLEQLSDEYGTKYLQVQTETK